MMMLVVVIMVVMVLMTMNLSRTGDTARSQCMAQWRTLVNSVIDMTQH
jgi:hypothetical protein